MIQTGTQGALDALDRLYNENSEGLKRLAMVEKVKFVTVTRTIDPKTRIHYLDAIDENGQHWMAEMSHKEENWIVFTRVWHKDAQVPYD